MGRGSDFADLVEVIVPAGGAVVVLRYVYMDESGTHDGSPAVVMAGYVFEKEQAQRFSRDWGKDLKRFGLPNAHMTDCATGNGHYAKLTMQERIAAETALIAHTRHRSLFGVAVGVDYQRYKELFSNQQRFEFDAYTYCLSQCVTAICILAKALGYDGKLAFIFEAGHAAQNEASSVMASFAKAELGKAYSSHAFVKKEDAPPLQAADMLAWQYAHYLKRRDAGHPEKRKDFVALLHPKDQLHELNRKSVEDFRQFTDNLNQVLIESIGDLFPASREQAIAYAREHLRTNVGGINSIPTTPLGRALTPRVIEDARRRLRRLRDKQEGQDS